MTDYRVNPGEVEEDQFTAAIEKTTSRIPTSTYLALALGAMAVSAALQAWNKKHESHVCWPMGGAVLAAGNL